MSRGKKYQRVLRIRQKTDEDKAMDALIQEMDNFVESLDNPSLLQKWEKTKARSYEALRYKNADYSAFLDKTSRNPEGRIELNIGPLKFIDDLMGGGMDSTLVLSKRVPRIFKGKMPPMTLRYAQRRRSRSRAWQTATRCATSRQRSTPSTTVSCRRVLGRRSRLS